MKSSLLKAYLRAAARPSDLRGGFTLLEVMVVVAIVGILAAIAGPSWVGYAQARRAGAAQDQIVQAIRLAQAEALRTRQAQTVQFNLAADPPTVTVRGQTETVGAGNNPSSTVARRSISVQSPATTIRFLSNGSLEDTLTTPLTITVTAPAGAGTSGTRRCVVIETLLGAVRTANPGQPNCP